jgi:hypothetical protein
MEMTDHFHAPASLLQRNILQYALPKTVVDLRASLQMFTKRKVPAPAEYRTPVAQLYNPFTGSRNIYAFPAAWCFSRDIPLTLLTCVENALQVPLTLLI